MSNNQIPIVVGGSGLYIKTLIDGIFNAADKDEDYRAELLFKRSKFGNEYLYKELLDVDPQSAKKMLPQNWKRVMRALEVYHLTGEPIWKHHEKQKRDSKYQFLQFGLNWEREILYENINSRVDKMLSNGLVNEVKNLLNEGYSKKINSLNTVGYKEIISYLENEITLERAIELIKRNTRRYAKRQLTWFRKDERIKWFDVKDYEDLNNVANQIFLNVK
jgi:tRNA dimethylallyltransferase